MQMLLDRGYVVTKQEEEMTKRGFISKYGENMKREDRVIQKAKRNDASDQVSV
jgi:DNA-directed RNA polymerase I, II, and III subunit RPABC1